MLLQSHLASRLPRSHRRAWRSAARLPSVVRASRRCESATARPERCRNTPGVLTRSPDIAPACTSTASRSNASPALVSAVGCAIRRPPQRLPEPLGAGERRSTSHEKRRYCDTRPEMPGAWMSTLAAAALRADRMDYWIRRHVIQYWDGTHPSQHKLSPAQCVGIFSLAYVIAWRVIMVANVALHCILVSCGLLIAGVAAIAQAPAPNTPAAPAAGAPAPAPAPGIPPALIPAPFDEALQKAVTSMMTGTAKAAQSGASTEILVDPLIDPYTGGQNATTTAMGGKIVQMIRSTYPQFK